MIGIKDESILYRFTVKVSGRCVLNTRAFEDALDAEVFFKENQTKAQKVDPVFARDYEKIASVFELAKNCDSIIWIDTRTNYEEDMRTPSQWFRFEFMFSDMSSFIRFHHNVKNVVSYYHQY